MREKDKQKGPVNRRFFFFLDDGKTLLRQQKGGDPRERGNDPMSTKKKEGEAEVGRRSRGRPAASGKTPPRKKGEREP